ncbi:MAG: RNA polymerase sigma factor [Deltaproteobacteria bacterium]|nr:RNA polymerase sigma factor [Deltaproteobacteria bacterium]
MTQPEGLDATYRHYFPMIREKCRRILGNAGDAQDVAQETFLRFWQRQDTLRVPEAAVAWIYKTATHLAIDKLRTSRQLATLDDTSADTSNPEILSHARDLLHKLAKDLPADEMEAAVLSRLDGLNQQEVAAVMGISERSVRRVLRRLDDRLANMSIRYGVGA